MKGPSLAGTIVLAAALAAGGAAWRLGCALERDRFEHASDLLLGTAAERVVEMRGVLRSMVGMHYASDEFAGADIEAFAEQLRLQTPFVESLGVVATVEPVLRADYERYAVSVLGRERPVRAWMPGAEGRPAQAVAARRRERGGPYWVVDSVESPGVGGAEFVGTDLSTVPALARRLEAAIVSGRGIAAPVPAAWPVRGDVLLVQPVYLDERPPEDPDERRDSLVGAVWVTLDLAGWLDGARGDVGPGVAWRLALDGEPVAAGSRGSSGTGVDGRGFDVGFGAARAERAWPLGDSEVRLVAGARLGASSAALGGIAAAATLAALFGLALVALAAQRRLRVRRERELTAELERRAHTDPLTGCHNRFHFERCLRELVDDAARAGGRHAFCAIDLDRFKIVNDTCGHPAGDRLLRELGEALRPRVRHTDVLARLGGDEFGILLRDVGEEAVHRIADSVLEHFRTAAFEHEGRVFPVRASIGVVGISGPGADVDRVLQAADAACYEAKRGGRDALVVRLDEGPPVQSHEETPWVPVLEEALRADRVGLLVRPLRAAGGDEVEVTVVLRDAEGDALKRAAWQSSAERHGLIGGIERRGIELALDAPASAGDTVALSLSGPTLDDDGFAPWLEAALATRGIDGARLRLLVAEDVVLARHARCAELAARLGRVGVRCTLDRFGEALSSLGTLAELPFDAVRLHPRWAQGLGVDPRALQRVRALCALARAGGLACIVDGADGAAALEALDQVDIDGVQGEAIGGFDVPSSGAPAVDVGVRSAA